MGMLCFVYSLVDGHLSCFHILVIMSNAAINGYARIFVGPDGFILFGCLPENGIAGI